MKKITTPVRSCQGSGRGHGVFKNDKEVKIDFNDDMLLIICCARALVSS